MKDHPDYLRQDYERTEIPQDTQVTQKQLNYIEILKNDLGMSIQTRNAHITSIVGKRWLGRFTPGISTVPDVWALSRSEASQVIGKFKQWKEETKK